MILTVTLNASIDKRYQLAGSIADYEVQRVKAVTNTAGGKGLNCTRAIAAFSEPVLPTGFVGGFNGEYLCHLLSSDGIEQEFVQAENETRSCINVLDTTGASTEFLEPSECIEPQHFKTFLEHYAHLLQHGFSKNNVKESHAGSEQEKEESLEASQHIQAVTLNGSLPKGAPADFYAQLIALAHKEKIPVLLDTSGEALLQALPASPTFIKPNLDEIAVLLDAELNNGAKERESQEAATDKQQLILKRIKEASSIEDVLDDIVSLAQSVSEKYQIPYVSISLGKDGALLYHDGHAYYGKPPIIKAVNPVGSGDTMVGAFAVGFVRGLAPQDMLVSAIAAASANCLTDKTGSFKYADYERIKEQVELKVL